ncbi:MAG: DNA processing protein [Paraglaciecola sp.]|jgi:DNA processing protein
MQKEVHYRQGSADTSELAKWLLIAQIPRFGAANLAKMLTSLEISIEQIVSAKESELKSFGFSESQVHTICHPNKAYIERSLDWLTKGGNRFLLPLSDPFYPLLLNEIAKPPLLIYGYGNKKLLPSSQIAIVGSRNPTASGKENAKYFARSLTLCGWTVTSGLAMGVDGLSHQGALLGSGKTIAVLGTGIDQIYPRRHAQLAAQIIERNGTIVSEFAPGTPVRPDNFPRRNRIISGMSVGTLIIEAAIKSGSLITARYALEQDREVFAVPGNIHNPLSKGCHYLIKQGAKLVEAVEDINEEFQNLDIWQKPECEKKLQINSTQSLASDLLLDSVDFEATSLDIVAERSGIPISQVMSQLLEYELRGLVTAVPGGYLKLGEK